MKIKSPKDFWSGLMFIGSGLFFMIWAMSYYQMGTAVRMGPAYFPTVLGGLLAVLGVIILAESLMVVPEGDATLVLPFNIVEDRKSTRLNSSHMSISYAVFCLKK